MAKNNNTKTQKVKVTPETEKEKQIAKQSYKNGYEIGKSMGHVEEAFDNLNRTFERENNPKVIRKKMIKGFLDGFCYTFTAGAIVLVGVYSIKKRK